MNKNQSTKQKSKKKNQSTKEESNISSESVTIIMTTSVYRNHQFLIIKEVFLIQRVGKHGCVNLTHMSKLLDLKAMMHN